MDERTITIVIKNDGSRFHIESMIWDEGISDDLIDKIEKTVLQVFIDEQERSDG